MHETGHQGATDAEYDPTAGLEDEPAADSAHTREELFQQAKLGFVRIRKDFVQRETRPRRSVLADLVAGRKTLALDLLLTVHALQPILGDPLHIATWARLLGDNVTVRRTKSALNTLEEMNLLEVHGRKGTPEITLKRENGDGQPWTGRWDDPATRGRGYLTLPFDYWTTGTIVSRVK